MPIPREFATRKSTPRWVWYAGGVALLAGGYWWYRNKQNSASSSSVSSTSSATAPTLESTGFTSNVTDTSNNLPFEDTWPYNQLALPYNYNNQSSSFVNNNVNDVMPYAPGSTVSTPVGS